MNEIKSGIYCIKNKENNKRYIGQSTNINTRFTHHKNDLNNNRHHNDYLQKSWNKYGEDSFEFLILELCDIEMLDEKEVYYIHKYNTLNSDFGYNLKEGGQSGNSYASDYVKEKMSKSLKEAYNLNPELKEMRKIKALEQWSNPDVKAKIIGENNGMYGKHHSEETRKKMSDKAKGRISKKRNLTPVLCKELNEIFACAAEAARKLSVNSGQILQVCYGNRKTCGGYHWKFIIGE